MIIDVLIIIVKLFETNKCRRFMKGKISKITPDQQSDITNIKLRYL